MGTHLIDGQFQSDKYPTTPPGKVPLSVDDPLAHDLLWEYSQRRRSVDAEFSDDLETALRAAGYSPPPNGAVIVVDPSWVTSLVHTVESYLKKSSDKAQLRHVLSGYQEAVTKGASTVESWRALAIPGRCTCGEEDGSKPLLPHKTWCAMAEPGIDLRHRLRLGHHEAARAYGERNKLVAAFARFALREPGAFWFAGIGKHQPAEDLKWDPEWTNVVFVDTPQGQLSWHVHDRDLPLFDGLPTYLSAWDGHSSAEKYERLARVIAKLDTRKPPDGVSSLAQQMIDSGQLASKVALSFLCESLVMLRVLDGRKNVELKVKNMLDQIERAARETGERQKGKA